MSGQQPMPPTRRRPISGMAGRLASLPQADSFPHDHLSDESVLGGGNSPQGPPPTEGNRGQERLTATSDRDGVGARAETRIPRRPAGDYATTRLVNFRIPVDLHDRFRGLVRETEIQHRRLRKPSLTELVIALLEEGPQTADEVAEMIRRKRAAEHEEA
jgi:hypothetical protein